MLMLITTTPVIKYLLLIAGYFNVNCPVSRYINTEETVEKASRARSEKLVEIVARCFVRKTKKHIDMKLAPFFLLFFLVGVLARPQEELGTALASGEDSGSSESGSGEGNDGGLSKRSAESGENDSDKSGSGSKEGKDSDESGSGSKGSGESGDNGSGINGSHGKGSGEGSSEGTSEECSDEGNVSKRSAENSQSSGTPTSSDSSSDDNGLQVSGSLVPALLQLVSQLLGVTITSLTDLVTKLRNGLAGEPIQSLLNFLTPLNVENIVGRLNPIGQLLKNVPVVGSVVNLLNNVLSLPINLLTNVLTVVVTLLGTVIVILSRLSNLLLG